MTPNRILSALLVLTMAGPAVARSKGNVDAFLSSEAQRPLAVSADAAERMGLKITHTERRLGVPTFVWSTEDQQAAGNLYAFSPSTDRVEFAARGHLESLSPLYRLSSEHLGETELKSRHDLGRGPVIAQFGQRVNGIEVFRSELKIAMDQELNLISASGYLAGSDLAPAGAFSLSAADAVARSFNDLKGTSVSPSGLRTLSTVSGDYVKFDATASLRAAGLVAGSPARAKQIYFPMPDRLEPAYYVEVEVGSADGRSSDAFGYVISARNGDVLFRNDLTAHASYTYTVWADTIPPYTPHDGPQGTEATPHPTGLRDGYQAPFIPPNQVTLESIPGNDPWLPDNATITSGNNVEAYADLVAPDGFQLGTADFHATPSGPNEFNYVYDTAAQPDGVTQQQASITSLFYVTNWLHDWFYSAGFDEASGNAQALNFGRGGVEGDALRVEAQDNSGMNNANMQTFADGGRPRMQMYLWDPVSAVRVNAPASISRTMPTGTAAFGTSVYDLTGDVLARNANAPDGSPQTDTVCDPSTIPADAFAGKIALVDRGACAFTVKALNAQNAGAIAVVIANNTGGLIGMSGDEPAITVPVVSILQDDANDIRAAIRAGETVNMSMRTGTVTRDGTIDNAIVAHEWGHYLSNRLISNASGLVNYQGRAMGEGWSDFVAMLMMVRDSDRTKPGNDQFQGVYAVASYSTSGAGNDGYYEGIRRLGYSTDMTKNGLTLKHMSNGIDLPEGQAYYNKLSNSQYHSSGEIWATMLWECYASLLNAHPFQEAQDRMKQYLVAGLKLTPSSPTFLEARDALLAAAKASDPADYQRFVSAFAKRGAGFGAVVADRNTQDNVGVIESFETGNSVQVSVTLDDSQTTCDADGVLDVGEVGLLRVTVRNVGGADLPAFNATVTAGGTSSTLAFTSGNTLAFGAIAPGQSQTRTLPVTLSAVAAPLPTAELTVTFDSTIPPSQNVVTYDGRVNYDETGLASTSDDVESAYHAWSVGGTNSLGGWKRVKDGENTVWHARAPAATAEYTLTSPWLQVGQGDFKVDFKARWSFESDDGVAPWWDGGVVEVSWDGIEWTNAIYILNAVQSPFPAYRDASGNLTVIESLGDYGYGGINRQFPGMTPESLNFKTFFAGEKVQIRFRVSSDVALGGHGLEIDDVVVTGADNLPFSARVDEPAAGGSCNKRPFANAGLNQNVAERDDTGALTVIWLNGTGSFDPEGSALTYQWTQTGGPSVVLNDATTGTPTFTADIAATTLFTFQLVVTDASGTASLPKTVNVAVSNSNRAPVAGQPTAAPNPLVERTVITLTGSATDLDPEDAASLTYTWTASDPAVTIEQDGGPTATFTAPEVAVAGGTIGITLVASDGKEDSEPVEVVFAVANDNRAPVVSAGADLTVDENTPVALTATASDPDGDALTYSWAQTTGVSASVTGSDTATLAFQAPDVPTAGDVLTFVLTVTDSNGATTPSTVQVTVNHVNRKAVADAGNPQTVSERSVVTLDATGSFDPDGDLVTYLWTQTGGPSVGELSNPIAAQPTFTAPEVTGDTVLTFEVQVDDGSTPAPAIPPTATTTVLVKNVNRAPTAAAGADATDVNEGALVTLSSTGSSDVDGQSITYLWTQIAGTPVALSDATAAAPTFTAPEVSADDSLTFQLLVSDGELSASSTVTVAVRHVNKAPVLTTNGNQTVVERTAVALTAAATDADGQALTYVWTQTVTGTEPVVLAASHAGASLAFTAPDVKKDGAVLTFEVTVSDGTATDTEIVTVTITDKNRAPRAVGGRTLTVDERTKLTLVGSDSFDEDGDPLTFTWTQELGPEVTFTTDAEGNITFDVPEVAANDTLTFALVVSDGELVSEATLFTVTVRHVNRAPTAAISAREGYWSGETVTLDGSGSSDPDGAVTYTWKQVSGMTVHIADVHAATLSFTAPEVAAGESTDLTFELTVTDGENLTSTETVTFKVLGEERQAAGCSTSGSSGSSMLGLLALVSAAFFSRRKFSTN